MAFFKPSMANGEVNGGWNPFNSESSSTNHPKFKENFQEFSQVYDQNEDGRRLDPIEFTGSQAIDTMRFVDPSIHG